MLDQNGVQGSQKIFWPLAEVQWVEPLLGAGRSAS